MSKTRDGINRDVKAELLNEYRGACPEAWKFIISALASSDPKVVQCAKVKLELMGKVEGKFGITDNKEPSSKELVEGEKSLKELIKDVKLEDK